MIKIKKGVTNGLETPAKRAILIKGALIFDGKSRELIKGSDVLVGGKPLENLGLVADPTRNFVIMKDGKIYKNTTDETKEETT